MRKPFAVIACMATLALSPLAGMAQNYPNKPVSVIVPLPVGTASDLLARVVGEGLSKSYGEQVVILNQPGAGGVIGSSNLVKAQPDGYTLALIAPPHLLGPLLQAKPAYRPLEDIAPVIEVATIPNVVVVAPNIANTLQELVAKVKAKPGQFNFASFGDGTVGHIAAVILNLATHMNAVHVPFKGLGPISGAMIQGDVHYFVPATTTAVGLVRGSSGRLKALAVTSAKRSIAFPDVPTVKELGVPDAEFDSWYGIVAPAGTPAALVQQLNADIAKVLKQPETMERFRAQDAHVPDDTSASAFAALLKSEHARFQNLIRTVGLKVQ